MWTVRRPAADNRSHAEPATRRRNRPHGVGSNGRAARVTGNAPATAAMDSGSNAWSRTIPPVRNSQGQSSQATPERNTGRGSPRNQVRCHGLNPSVPPHRFRPLPQRRSSAIGRARLPSRRPPSRRLPSRRLSLRPRARGHRSPREYDARARYAVLRCRTGCRRQPEVRRRTERQVLGRRPPGGALRRCAGQPSGRPSAGVRHPDAGIGREQQSTFNSDAAVLLQ